MSSIVQAASAKADSTDGLPVPPAVYGTLTREDSAVDWGVFDGRMSSYQPFYTKTMSIHCNRDIGLLLPVLDGNCARHEAGRIYGIVVMVLSFTVPGRQLTAYQKALFSASLAGRVANRGPTPARGAP
jgi:hypothetical protein